MKIACDEVVDQFLRINNIVADHKMTFMERASLRSECRKLTRFLRLVDFIVIDTMRNLALDSVRETVRASHMPGWAKRQITCLGWLKREMQPHTTCWHWTTFPLPSPLLPSQVT